MFNFSELNYIQVEITNNCQASCPMCQRNVRGGLPNENLTDANWTLEDFKTILDPEVINQLSVLLFCGSNGDPILNNDLLKMVEYTISTNKQINLTINTNGGARSTAWWTELGKLLASTTHIVRFGIDGLEDTHSLHRIGTTYQKVIDNATAFIKAGGLADWQYIVFKHNEHQIDKARKIALELGFTSFQIMESNRFMLGNVYDVYAKDGTVSHQLMPPTNTTIKQIDKEFVMNYSSIAKDIAISCESKEEKSLYIDAFGHLYPCCYLGGMPYVSDNIFQPLPTNDATIKLKWDSMMFKIKKQISQAIKKIGGHSCIDLKVTPLKEVLNNGLFKRAWEEQHYGDKNIMCCIECGYQCGATDPARTKFKDLQTEINYRE